MEKAPNKATVSRYLDSCGVEVSRKEQILEEYSNCTSDSERGDMFSSIKSRYGKSSKAPFTK